MFEVPGYRLPFADTVIKWVKELKKAKKEHDVRSFLSRVRSFSARHGMFGYGMRIVVGVSGGADSVGLLQVLRDLAPEYDLQLHVVHLNHMLRPEAADDAAFVRQLAHRLGLPVTTGCARIGAIAGRLRTGIEDAGRLARYRLFEQVADRIGAQRIAVGHHAGDQVETVLFNIMRGTGPGGLAGIPPRRGRVVRPLLCASREEIEAYCRVAGLEWRTDASNLSPEFLRNRIRHRLLPLLQKEYNPRLDRAILHLAEIAGEENRWFQCYIQSLLDRLMVDGGAGAPAEEVRLTLSAFLRLPLAVRRRLVLAAVRRVWGSHGPRQLGYQNVEDCLDFLSRGATGGTVELPGGVRIRKDSAYFTIYSTAPGAGPAGAWHSADSSLLYPGLKAGRPVSDDRSQGLSQKRLLPGCPLGAGTRCSATRGQVPLTVPGKTLLPELGLAIHARVVDLERGLPPGAHPADERGAGMEDSRVCFDYDQLELPLAVRTRRAGDRLRLFGMQGTKRLKKLLGELRIPAGARDRVALVVSNGQIIWVAGYRRAQAAPVAEQTSRLLILEAERL
jgi:tRNA(Ile)-lysidine synthase